MALELRKELASAVTNPSGSHATFFIDENGQPAVKDALGNVAPAASLDGAPLVLAEGTAPSAENDKGKLYAKDVNGITELFYRDDLANTGKETQLTRDGLIGATPSTLFDDSGIAELNIAMDGGGGTTTLNTGLIFPILGDNQIVSIYLRIEGALDSGNGGDSDVGDGVFILAWNTAPAIPSAIDGLIKDQSGGNDWNVFLTLLNTIDVNGAGELTIELDNSKGDAYEATLRISISPGKSLSFDPSFL